MSSTPRRKMKSLGSGPVSSYLPDLDSRLDGMESRFYHPSASLRLAQRDMCRTIIGLASLPVSTNPSKRFCAACRWRMMCVEAAAKFKTKVTKADVDLLIMALLDFYISLNATCKDLFLKSLA